MIEVLAFVNKQKFKKSFHRKCLNYRISFIIVENNISSMSTNKEFKINDYLALRLEREQKEQKTVIYVSGERFQQCKFLLLTIPKEDVGYFDKIDSIDEASAKLDRSQERNSSFKLKIPAEVEFWGHCSNLQMWAEHYYDTRLLHSNLAFPLLKKLTEAGDPVANRVFREEIAKRLASGFPSVIEFLTEEGYLKYLTHEEIVLALLELKEAETLLRIEKIIGMTFEILSEYPEFRKGPSLIVKNRRVEMISLFDCDLKIIPYDLKSFVKIEMLDLGRNQLSTLPEWICKLKNLKDFTVSGNKINKFPIWITNLKNLEFLDLRDNKLNIIPESIGKLKKLKIFYISNCPIDTIPESVLNLRLLTYLDIHNNFLTDISKKILIQWREKIKKNDKRN